MHVISYEVHNVLRISDMDMDMEGRNLVLIGGKNDQGKCLPEGTPVNLWDGSQVPIEDVRETHLLCGFDAENYEFIAEHPLQLMTNGVKECYRITTRSGHQIEATGNHRLMSEDGWTELSKLSIGDMLVVPVRIPAGSETKQESRLSEALLAGMLLGDGSLTRGMSLTAKNCEVHRVFVRCVRELFPTASVKTHGITHDVRHFSGLGNNPPWIQWMEHLGMAGCNSFEKKTPEAVFQWGHDAIRHYAAGLIMTDGHVLDCGHMEFSSRSESLTRGLWRALLRLGIESDTRGRIVAGKPVYCLRTTRNGWDTFNQVLRPLIPETRVCDTEVTATGSLRAGFSGKKGGKRGYGQARGRTYCLPVSAGKALYEMGVKSVRPWAKKGRRMSRRVFLERSEQILPLPLTMQKYISEDVGYSDIVSIEPIGKRQTFDLEMPSGAFLANDFLVHNSSAIKALLMALCGRSGMEWPAPALAEGEDEGWVRVKLSGHESLMEDNFVIAEVHFERKRDGSVADKFRLLNSVGDESPNPRALLKALYENKAFDPLAFDRAAKKDRRQTLMKLVGLDLDSFKAKHKEIYDNRTLKNKEVASAEAKFKAMPIHPDVGEPVVVSELVEQLEKADDHNNTIKMADRLVADSEKMATDSSNEVARLEDELKAAIEINNLNAEAHTNALAQRKKLGDEVSTDEIKEAMKAAGETNALIKANADRDNAETEYMRLAAEAKKLTSDLKKLERDQDAEMKKASWPVPGMSIDNEGVLLDGLPYESACKSKRVTASVHVGMSLHPELRLLVCEDGSDLDLETLEQLEKDLIANDFQLLVEYVTRSKEDEERCAVVIEDGSVKIKNQPPAEKEVSEEASA